MYISLEERKRSRVHLSIASEFNSVIPFQVKSKSKTMKTKSLVFFITLFTAVYSYSQYYEITDVNPKTFIPGQLNNVIVKLSEGISGEDSIINAELQVYSKDYPPETFIYSSTIEVNDTLVNITFDIPNQEYAPQAHLYLNMRRFDSYYGRYYYDSTGYHNELKIGNEVSFIRPEICIVQVDTSNKNVLYWEAPANELLDSVYIYKETFILNEYEKIETKTINDISMYRDLASIPAQNSNRYKIAFSDTLGNISSMSYAHKTIHLSINAAIGGAVNLAWNNYEGFYYSTFSIYRGLSKDNLTKIADIASNLYTYSDITPPIGDLYYEVRVTKLAPCFVKGIKPGTEALISTKSNLQVFKSINTSEKQISDNNFSMYPNPVKDDLFITLHNESFISWISIYDMTGRLVHGPIEMNAGLVLSLSDLQYGIYLLKMSNSNSVLSRIFVKE